MEIRQLQYFLAVAEELNFTNAALKLHVAQQPVSAQIKKLEEELGVKLFERTTRKVTLTPAGNAFLDEIEQVFFHLEKAIKDVRTVSNLETITIKIAYETPITHKILPVFIKTIHKKFPNIKIELHELEAHEIYNNIKNENIDIGLMYIDYTNFKSGGFGIKKLGVSKAVIAVPKNHPYVERESISLKELSKEKFVLVSKSVKPNFYNKFIGLCNDADFQPNIVQEVTTEQALISLVSEGIGITMVFDSLQNAFKEFAGFVPLTNPTLSIDYGILWKDGKKHARIDKIINMKLDADYV